MSDTNTAISAVEIVRRLAALASDRRYTLTLSREQLDEIRACAASRAPGPVPATPPKCAAGHAWTNNYGDDWYPDYCTPCDCGLRRYGLEAHEYPPAGPVPEGRTPSNDPQADEGPLFGWISRSNNALRFWRLIDGARVEASLAFSTRSDALKACDLLRMLVAASPGVVQAPREQRKEK